METSVVVGILFLIVFCILVFLLAKKSKANYEKMTPEEKIAHNTKTLATIELLRLADRD